jgi:hypothetical protein
MSTKTDTYLKIFLLTLVVCLLSLTFAPAPISGYAQKQRAMDQVIDLDSTIAPLTGKRVMYVLTDDEGGLQLDATGQGRKVPAIISYNYRTKRDADGHLVSPLTIFRPSFVGGFLLKDEVPSDSGRSPGTWDNAHPGDLRN